jgi:flagellar motor switch/type III secretory pathway protein FliN
MKLAENPGSVAGAAAITGHALALTQDLPETNGIAEAVAPRISNNRWNLYSGLTLQAMALVPLRDMLLSELMQMRAGTLLRSPWLATSDVLLYINEVLLGLVSLEPAESSLGFRLNSLAETKTKEVPLDRSSNSSIDGRPATEGLQAMKVPVALCLGTKRIDLQEVLSITLGDLLPLDRGLEEQVTILVDRRIFASGNLLLINGCYAIEVTHVGPPGSSSHRVGLLPAHLERSGAQVLKAGSAPTYF